MSGYIKKEKEKRKRKTGFKNILSNFSFSHISEEYFFFFFKEKVWKFDIFFCLNYTGTQVNNHIIKSKYY